MCSASMGRPVVTVSLRVGLDAAVLAGMLRAERGVADLVHVTPLPWSDSCVTAYERHVRCRREAQLRLLAHVESYCAHEGDHATWLERYFLSDLEDTPAPPAPV